MTIGYQNNSSLENYNKVIKDSLGKKKIIHWLNNMSFLKGESVKIQNKLINNILYKANFTKFGINKYINNGKIQLNSGKLENINNELTLKNSIL